MPGLLILLRHLGEGGAGGAAVAEFGEGELGEREGEGAFLVGADLGAFFEVGDALFQTFEVGQHQLGLDDFEIGERIDPALDVGHIPVLETARDKGHGVAVADGGEELVAEPFALAGAAHEARPRPRS